MTEIRQPTCIFFFKIAHTQSFKKASSPFADFSLEIGKKLCNEFHIHINREDSVVYVFFISFKKYYSLKALDVVFSFPLSSRSNQL